MTRKDIRNLNAGIDKLPSMELVWTGEFQNGEGRPAIYIQKLLLLALVDHANRKTGQCNPGYKRLGERCGIASIETLRKAMRALENDGWIKRMDTTASKEYGLLFIEKESVRDYAIRAGLDLALIEDLPRLAEVYSPEEVADAIASIHSQDYTESELQRLREQVIKVCH